MTTGKTIAFTRRTFVGTVMSLLFNMLSRLVITFLPRSKRLLISCLQSPSAVILEPRKIKSATVSTVSPSIFQEVMQGSDYTWKQIMLSEMVNTWSEIKLQFLARPGSDARFFFLSFFFSCLLHFTRQAIIFNLTFYLEFHVGLYRVGISSLVC